MKLEGMLSDWQRWTCSHRWVRARWQDGSYGLRCSHCMKPYRHTWEQIIAGPQPRASRSVPVQGAEGAGAELTALRRAA